MEDFETGLGYIKRLYLRRTREKREGKGKEKRMGVSGSSFKFLYIVLFFPFFHTDSNFKAIYPFPKLS